MDQADALFTLITVSHRFQWYVYYPYSGKTCTTLHYSVEKVKQAFNREVDHAIELNIIPSRTIYAKAFHRQEDLAKINTMFERWEAIIPDLHHAFEHNLVENIKTYLDRMREINEEYLSLLVTRYQKLIHKTFQLMPQATTPA